ncbi:MAG: non-lysosomal glucosylceramidase [candidate division KSB1 bacterium]|nr:non-lysosomal glucosylceramidase [candidate division KSB1 bacterium]MDZ7334349.1 non-lysosomal glucosylceramidase [candidate division KSB1 bacterium]MDZ7356390.1 non-lysosomal glucosylceramidase [candidate division KSB1 bacterium]MDZ7399302.1 non-lysosomal glucosylceramidase [candidate division KSB1 bacterium]
MMILKLLYVGMFILGSTILALAAQPYDKKVLYDFSPIKTLRGDYLKEVAFPIGGIGTGNITLGGRGELRDWEIFNRPGKGKQLNLTFFSIWMRAKGQPAVAKILERKFFPPYTGWMGFPRNNLAGVPRFNEIEFRGEYPFGWLKFFDPKIPLTIELEAYNPFIPLDPDNSGIPAAIFNWTITNPLDVPVEAAICLSMQNPIGTDGKTFDSKLVHSGINEFLTDGTLSGIKFSSSYLSEDDIRFGTMAIMTPAKELNVLTCWYRGGWWDNAHIFWDDFSDDGWIADRREKAISPESHTDVASLNVHFQLSPKERRKIPFYLTWHFPQRENYWNSEPEVHGKKMTNYYATKFADAVTVARYLVDHLDYLEGQSRQFHHALFSSTLPNFVLDAVGSQLSILKTNTVMRIHDGPFFGFEGISDEAGCCWMNCSHVWNYAQTVAFLFPSLERSARETDFLHNTYDNGYMPFRSLVPLGDYRWKFKPCADGQMGAILRAYREWKLSGDNAWLARLWPKIKASLEFAWKGVGDIPESLQWQKENLPVPWDGNKDGVIEGEQHNTYDIEFYGPNTMTGSLYLAALKAAAEMARFMDDSNAANTYLQLYKNGSAQYDALLWNGKFYVQKIHVAEGIQIPAHLQLQKDDLCCPSKASQYGKKGELDQSNIPKYQFGKGCLSDQLLGQFAAFVTGLGYIMEPSHVKRALQSIFEHNFQTDLANFSNVQRVYALNDEAGLLLCTWPDGDRPALPFVYSDEVWTGIEYQVAASLIYAGLIDEGLTLVKAVRDRHDGLRRNPWDEFECGHHYARALASWAVLLAISGFQYDGVKQMMGFSPVIHLDQFQVFWSCGTGWGIFSQNPIKISLKVLFGELLLSQFSFSADPKSDVRAVMLDKNTITFKSVYKRPQRHIQFDKPLKISSGSELNFMLKAK